MTHIKSISDLRNKSGELNDLVQESNEPVYITKNGEGEMVLMSMKYYSYLEKKIELLSKLSESQSDFKDGDTGRSLDNVMSDIKKRIQGE
jgi:prevent-host-death family protein